MPESATELENEDSNQDDMSSDWFYGPKKKRKSDEEQSKNDASKPIDPKVATLEHPVERKRVKCSLFEESLGCFNVFKRQREALLKREQEGSNSRVFSFEHSLSNAGQRRYLVTTIERFWRWYDKRDNVSFYELIPDSTPSRLYFDLEFYRASNHDAVENQLVADFNDVLRETLKEEFHIDIDPDEAMLVLDASTKSKFSEHVIVHLPGDTLFPSNVSMKSSLIELMQSKMVGSNRGIVWNRDADKTTTIFDAAVYTLNRNFRLYLSSKMGKNNPLVLSKRCRFYKRARKVTNKQIFIDSLVIPVHGADNCNVLETTPHNIDLCPEHHRKPTILNIAVRPSSQRNNSYVDFMSGYGSTSPFPILDFHIIAINQRWRNDVSIREWKMSKDVEGRSRRINYYLAGCRYCFNIHREHRSNHVYWVVDLEKLHCYQKCFDVDCHGTSSNFFPLPSFVRASIPSFQDVSTASVSEGVPSIESLHRDSSEITAELDKESEGRLVSIRRRSATFEKTFNLKDSFYDNDLDNALLAIEDCDVAAAVTTQ